MCKHIKKILSIVIALSLCPVVGISEVKAEEKNAVFADISGHWAENDIEYLYNNGIISGVSETEFMPDEIIDKKQFITMLVRAMGIETDKYSISYSDVSPIDDWFAGYFGGAVNAGILEDSNFTAYPDKTVSRAEAAEYLYGAMEYSGLTEKIPEKSISYTDISSDSYYEKDNILDVSAMSIMVGTTETEFEPDGVLTRAQAASTVKRLALAAETIEEVKFAGSVQDTQAVTMAEEGTYSFSNNGSYVAIGNIDFHYELSRFEATLNTLNENLELEIWIDSMDTLTGTKIGTISVAATGGGYQTQSTEVDRISGSHTVYLRMVGNGSISMQNPIFKADVFTLNFSKYSKIYLMQRSGSTLTNLKYGGYIEFDDLAFGDGYDTIEFTMKNSTEGQLFEIWANEEKAAVVETEASGDEGVTFSTSIVKVNGTKTISIKPIMNVTGTITKIRFLNKSSKADVYLGAEQAETALGIAKAHDYVEMMQTETVTDGDVIKFANVNMSDGYNVLSMRICDSGIKKGGLTIGNGNEKSGNIMTMLSDDNEAYFEIRLDGEEGQLIGILTKNPITVNQEYDTQSCYIYGAKGVHDLYLKAVGNVGWNVCSIRLQERGWYDIPLVTCEAENMTVNLGEVTNPQDIKRYEVHSIEAESSGKATVKITQSGGYVEFKVPEWVDGATDRMAITVRNSIPDKTSNNVYSTGQDGKMKVSVNGVPVTLLDSFQNFKEVDSMTLSSKYSQGYTSGKGYGASGLKQNTYKGFHYDDAYAVIKGEIKPGDIIRLEPEINDEITYCYIDCVDLEVIPEAKQQPEGYLSIIDCGAIANDGLDDGEALRKAVDEVNANPTKYRGIWIPAGTFDIYSYAGSNLMTAADFTGIRVLGSGEWTTKLLAHLGAWTDDSGNFKVGENTIVRSMSIHGTAIARRSVDGIVTGANAFNGWDSVFFENIWLEHWGAGGWISNPSGVFRNNRIKNTWADGINVNRSATDIIFEKNFMRGTGDDSIAVFSNCEYGEAISENIVIKANTTVAPWVACGIAIWGGRNIKVTHNMVNDVALHGGIGLKQWGVLAPAGENIWYTYNRIERCGNWNEGNQLNAAFEAIPGEFTELRNCTFRNIYFDNNECIDNPFLFMRISSHPMAENIYISFRNNYIRNTGLATPEERTLFIWHTSSVKGTAWFKDNVFDGEYDNLKVSRATEMEEQYIGNLPNNWN